MNIVEIIEKLWPEQKLPQYVLPAKERVTAPIPDWIGQSPIMPWVQKEIGGDTLWQHQAIALDAIARGENPALTTGTNSGKSFVPQAVFLHGLMTDKDATYLVMPPLTALNRDQMTRWDAAFKTLNLPHRALVKIDGTMPKEYRLPAMKDARLLFITPHSLHGWFLDNLDDPHVRRILKNLRGVFLDEVQEYEGVTGANVARLLRRVSTLHNMLNTDPERTAETAKKNIQWIAASGTIGSPKTFLKKLTSRDFTVIGPAQDGSRQNQRTILHRQAKTKTQIYDDGIRAILEAVEKGAPGLIMYFIDSRSGVEQVADTLQQTLGEDAVMAYSGKYTRRRSNGSAAAETDDDFNRRVKSSELKVIVTTSALQAGINLPNANFIVIANIPYMISDFLQRVGRSGRGKDDAAILLIGDNERFSPFLQEGRDGFTSYMETPVEAPHLVLENRALDFIHLQCLAAEREALGNRGIKYPSVVTWPTGTNEVQRLIKLARWQLPPELQSLKVPKNRSPNAEFSLLNTGMRQAMLAVRQEESGKDIFLTDMSVDRALREAPPGGTFRYGGKYYFVNGWHYMQTAQQSRSGWRISLSPSQSQAHTEGLVEQTVTFNLHSGSVIQNHFLSHPEGPENGFIAEMAADASLKLTGLKGRFRTEHGVRAFHLDYRDLETEMGETPDQAQPAPKPDVKKVRVSKFFAQKISTLSTGVVIHLPERWFGEETRDLIARTLITSHMRARGVEISDAKKVDTLSMETENVVVQRGTDDRLQDHSIAIFDNVQCGLRLSEPLYADFRMLLEDALREDEQALGKSGTEIIKRLLAWHATLVSLPLRSPQDFVKGERFAQPPPGHVLMLAVGSIVDYDREGIRTARRVVGHKALVNRDTGEKYLAYQLQAPYSAGKRNATAVSFNHAGQLVTHTVDPTDKPATISTVPADDVYAPKNHVRFSYAWINTETLEATPAVVVDHGQASITAPGSTDRPSI